MPEQIPEWITNVAIVVNVVLSVTIILILMLRSRKW